MYRIQVKEVLLFFLFLCYSRLTVMRNEKIFAQNTASAKSISQRLESKYRRLLGWLFNNPSFKKLNEKFYESFIICDADKIENESEAKKWAKEL